jgi:hypothetical protein
MFFGFLCYTAYVAYLGENGELIRAGEQMLYLEFAYIASFLRGVNAEASFFTGVQLPLASGNYGRSEYLTAIYAALLQSAGQSVQVAVFIETVMLFLSAVVLEYSLAYRFSKSELAACLSVPVCFLMGGTGFLGFPSSRNRLDPMVDYVGNLGSGDVNLWGHPLLHCLLTSRPALAAMALSILGFCCLEERLTHVAGVIGLAMVFVRPQTAVAFFSCFLLYRLEGFSERSPYALAAIAALLWVGIARSPGPPLWVHAASQNSICPPLTFAYRVMGLALPAVVMAAASPSLLERLAGPIATFYGLSAISLQDARECSYLSLIPTVVPIVSALSLASMVSFRDCWKGDETKGVISCAIVFVCFFMCLSSILGLAMRLHQKFVAWDAAALDLARWIDQNTPRDGVFVSAASGKWNPAVALAGRCSYLPFTPGLHSILYNARRREDEFAAFLSDNMSLSDVGFFVIERKEALASTMKMKIGSLVDLIYENNRFQLMKAR